MWGVRIYLFFSEILRGYCTTRAQLVPYRVSVRGPHFAIVKHPQDDAKTQIQAQILILHKFPDFLSYSATKTDQWLLRYHHRGVLGPSKPAYQAVGTVSPPYSQDPPGTIRGTSWAHKRMKGKRFQGFP